MKPKEFLRRCTAKPNKRGSRQQASRKELVLLFTGAALFRGGCGEEAPEGYLRKVLFNISSTIKLVKKHKCFWN